MLGRTCWRFGFLMLLIAVLSVGTAGLSGAFSPSATPIAYADNDNDGGGDDNDEEEREIEGQVLRVNCPTVRGSDHSVAAACADLPEGFVIPAVNPQSNPPDLYVHTVDGAVRVIVYDRDMFNRTGVAECNYVSIDGTRLNTHLFEGSDINVDDRTGCSRDNDND